VPADPDPDYAAVRLRGQGDVGDQGAQQPLAVLVAGGRGVPEPGEVGGEFLQLDGAGQRRQRVLGCGQGLLGVGEGGELGLPTGSRLRATSRFSGSTEWKARSARSAS